MAMSVVYSFMKVVHKEEGDTLPAGEGGPVWGQGSREPHLPPGAGITPHTADLPFY